MINTNNLRQLLQYLEFKQENTNLLSKTYPNGAYLKVDFENQRLIYPTDLEFKVSGEFTTNFGSSENAVVFECVDRLFTKGYKPEHIELEPKWSVGHGASGGRADILIKDNSGNPYLIIECKTFGYEFNKEWNNTLEYGGQIFTYIEQEKSVKFVCLYASQFENSQIEIQQVIISHTDNDKILEENSELISFKDATNVIKRYNVWKYTYQLEYTSKGIFEANIEAYNIGKNKITINELEEVNGDIGKKYHEFASILRQHNVSGRENAFDKLVNLFLCKIVDEQSNHNDLKFYWKGIANDTDFDLQDRLQRLYQAGMKQFLNEDVTYIENQAVDNAFSFFKKSATKDVIKGFFKELKYFSNNDFAFINVHNQKLFYQNSEVLLKIVKILQDIRLTGGKNDNQFLGDLFEGFLDSGVKQSEGQFFTPMPIVKFIVQSLPVASKIAELELPPKVIDYACGAGHFLTEIAKEIHQTIVDPNLVKEYYSNIHGIEKEYRLSKVSKVSAFMYGQNQIKILYADALVSNPEIKENDYDILVANPPFSVSGFLSTIPAKERDRYELTKEINEISTNKNIEAYFIELTAKLVKSGGVCAIILPSSILSNDKIYVRVREIIIKFFDIVSIVELPSTTFGKTGTNTVVLYLQKRQDLPFAWQHYQNRVESWFSDFESDTNLKTGENIVFEDQYFICDYCDFLEYDLEQYQTLLVGKPSQELLATEMFAEYSKAFDKLPSTKKLKPQVKPKELLKYLQKIEKDKLLYFILASQSNVKTLVVKSPTGKTPAITSKLQKQFLGYEWSNRKGSEGIKYFTQGVVIKETPDDIDIADESIDDIDLAPLEIHKSLGNIYTPLYNPHDRDDQNKINYWVKQNFLNNEILIPDSLTQFASYQPLINLLDFTRTDFNKTISLTTKKSNSEIEIKSKWEVIKLNNLMKIVRGASPRPIVNFITEDEGGENWIKIGDVKSGTKYITSTNEKITKEGALKSREVNIGDFVLSNSMSYGRPYICKIKGYVHDGWLVFSEFNNQLDKDYLYEILQSEIVQTQFKTKASGTVVDNLNIERVSQVKIPLPPLEIQNQIVAECEVVEQDVEKAKSEMERLKGEISEKINLESFSKQTKKIGQIIDINLHTFDPKSNPDTEFVYVDIDSIGKGDGSISYEQKILGKNLPSRARRIVKSGNTIISTVRPNLKGFAFIEKEYENTIYSTGFAVLETKSKEVLHDKIIFYSFLYSDNLMKQMENAMPKGLYPSINKSDIENIKIPVPPIEIQNQIVAEIELLEIQIAQNQAVINSSKVAKQQILDKYLN